MPSLQEEAGSDGPREDVFCTSVGTMSLSV